MEIQNDQWRGIEEDGAVTLIPKEDGKEVPKKAIHISYVQLRALAAIIVEISRGVEGR